MLAIIAAFALAACADTGGTPIGAPGLEDRRWSEGGVPRYRPSERRTATGEAQTGIGIVLPLSGRFGDYGQALLDAASLAVFERPDGQDIELLPRDSRASADGSAAAAVSTVADGAQLVIGPLAPVGVIAAGRASGGTPVLALAGARSLAGENIFLAGHAQEAMATRIVDFAARRGIRTIAGLAPRTRAGEAALNGLRAAASSRGVQLANAGFLEAGARPDQIANVLATILGGLGPDGALFLPFSAEQMPPILAGLQGRAPAMLLGLSDWESGGLARIALPAPMFYAGPDPALSAGFRARYAGAFGRPPPRGAALVYDLTAAAAAIGARTAGRRIGVQDVADPAGFRGIGGLFRFRVDGGTDRSYAIVGISGAGFQVVEPAPTQFGF